MTPREQLQLAYELAFHPARLNAAWTDWERGRIADVPGLRLVVDWALMLHQRLPEAPAASGRALRRLARYQANARLYRLPSMLRRFRDRLGGSGALPDEMPGWMARDIALPVFGRAPELQRRIRALKNVWRTPVTAAEREKWVKEGRP